jgi:plasmid maintenance system antidote protein VapI
VDGLPIKGQPHPGNLIKTEIIEVLGLNVREAAEILKASRATLRGLKVQERTNVSAVV